MFVLDLSTAKISSGSEKSLLSHTTEPKNTPENVSDPTPEPLSNSAGLLEPNEPKSELSEPVSGTDHVAARPLQVYSRREQPTPALLQAQESEPRPGIKSIHTSSHIPVIDDLDHPIAIRKGVRKCTKHPIAHLRKGTNSEGN